jgi:hypothetical protein
MLNVLTNEFGKERVGLYRDDGLVLIKGKSGRIADKVRKKLHTLFEQFNLKITAQVNHQSVNFLDVTFNLTEERYQPYRKPNNEPIYIDSRSNHPPAIIRQLPKSINHRISNLSSDQQTFNSSAPTYENALRRSNYDFNLQYNATPSSKIDDPNTESCTSSQPKRKRHRNSNKHW